LLASRLRDVQTVEQRILRLEAEYAMNAAQLARAGVGTLNETISRLVGLLAELRFAADEVRTWIQLDPGRAGRRLSRAIVAASQELPPGMRDPNPTPTDVVDGAFARFMGGA
jgi:hypothetical protein